MSRWDDVDFGGLTCRQFVDLVTDYLENRMEPEARGRFEQHVTACPGCARYLDQIRETRRVVGHVSLDDLSEQARAQLLTAFRSWRTGRTGGPASG